MLVLSGLAGDGSPYTALIISSPYMLKQCIEIAALVIQENSEPLKEREKLRGKADLIVWIFSNYGATLYLPAANKTA